MLPFVLMRIGTAALVLLVVSVLIFVGCEVLPGDIAQSVLGQYATEENLRTLRTALGLDEPAWLRYLVWLKGALLWDWGQSISTQTPVTVLLSERLSNTLLLTGTTTLLAVPLAVFLGVQMALGSGGAFDRACSATVLALSATPEFLIATIAVLILSVNLRWLPAVSFMGDSSDFVAIGRALFLPVLSLSLVIIAQIARLTRAIVVDVMRQPFIEMAILKGVPRGRVVCRHVLINAVGAIANVIALNIAYLVSGIAVVETVFAYPGVARLMVDAVMARDVPVIEACAMIFCATYVILILCADILSALADPRGQLRRSEGVPHAPSQR